MTRITIASLQARITVLEHTCEQQRTELAAYQVAQRPSRSAGKPTPIDHQGYWDYVRAVKKWSYTNNVPVSYLTRDDFDRMQHAAGVFA